MFFTLANVFTEDAYVETYSFNNQEITLDIVDGGNEFYYIHNEKVSYVYVTLSSGFNGQMVSYLCTV